MPVYDHYSAEELEYQRLAAQRQWQHYNVNSNYYNVNSNYYNVNSNYYNVNSNYYNLGAALCGPHYEERKLTETNKLLLLIEEDV